MLLHCDYYHYYCYYCFDLLGNHRAILESYDQLLQVTLMCETWPRKLRKSYSTKNRYSPFFLKAYSKFSWFYYQCKNSVEFIFLEIMISVICLLDSSRRPLRLATLLKKTLAEVFSCEFCEIPKNTFFYRIPLVAASI